MLAGMTRQQERRRWLAGRERRREEIRAYHDDRGHTWAETAAVWGVSVDTARQLAYRARRERAQAARVRREAREEEARREELERARALQGPPPDPAGPVRITVTGRPR